MTRAQHAFPMLHRSPMLRSSNHGPSRWPGKPYENKRKSMQPKTGPSNRERPFRDILKVGRGPSLNFIRRRGRRDLTQHNEGSDKRRDDPHSFYYQTAHDYFVRASPRPLETLLKYPFPQAPAQGAFWLPVRDDCDRVISLDNIDLTRLENIAATHGHIPTNDIEN